MLKTTQHQFVLNDHHFSTPKGPITGQIVNTPEDSSSENSDQRWFRITFSDGRTVMIVLSNKRLTDDPDGSYHNAAFGVIQEWLNNGGPPTIEV